MSLNKYVFDYGLVLKEDPTFEKYIEYEQEENEEVTEESLCRELIANIRARDGTEQENAEEDEIIDFVHDKDDGNKKFDLDDVDDNCNWSKHSKKTPQSTVNLKREYENPPNPNYDPSILQLLPPNRFLKTGSKIWLGDDTFYCFCDSYDHVGEKRGEFISAIARYHFSYHPPFIRLIDTVYWFDRAKNAMSEYKTHFKSWVYNMETRQIYFIKKMKRSDKKGSRFHNRVRRVFNILNNADWNKADNPDRLKDKFLNTITQIVIKDIGGVIIPDLDTVGDVAGFETQKMKLAVVLLQHRVGQPIKWLNYLFINNLWSIMGNLNFQANIEFNMRDTDLGRRTEVDKKRIMSSRRKTIGKLIPNLRKSNHMRTAVKTVLGGDYNKFFVKLFNLTIIQMDFLTTWIACTRKGLIDKDLYHWFVQSISDNNAQLVKEIIHAIQPMLSSLAFGHQENIAVRAKSYIRTCKRLKANEKSLSAMPSWHTWNDMYNMADQLNIRIRPNKLTESNIVIIHNKLTDIIRRDQSIINKYKDVIFDEFVSPDKEYDGFHFIQLRTAQELADEGIAMHHCVGGYANRCAEGRSIIFSMRKDGKSYITIELSPYKYNKRVQEYTLRDYTVTNEQVLGLINRWHYDCVALHVKDKETYYDKAQKRVKDYYAKKKKNDLIEQKKQLDTLFEEGITEIASSFDEGVSEIATAF